MKKLIKDLEKRLSNAYDSGFFDGYHEGIDDTHATWVANLTKVRGIGPKRASAILAHLVRSLQETADAKKLAKNELSAMIEPEA